MTSACNVRACPKTGCVVTRIGTKIGKVGVRSSIETSHQLESWPHTSIIYWISGAHRVRTYTIISRIIAAWAGNLSGSFKPNCEGESEEGAEFKLPH